MEDLNSEKTYLDLPTTNEPEQGCDTPFHIGKICSDKELNPRIVKATLTVAWNGVKLKGIHQLDNKTFSCSFGSGEHRNKILMGSTWFVKGQLFNLKRWSKSSNFDEIDFSIVQYWIQVHNLPLTE